jgi:tetratricopeptide (TPR) repeat protein
MRRSTLHALAALLVAASFAGGARADAAGDARALELFDKSEIAYQNGRFQEAVDLLRQAYELKKEPVLLYNLARAYEGLGDLDRAQKAYEDYLALQPNAKDKGSIEQRIVGLRRAIAEREAAKKRAADAAKRPLPEPKKPSPLPWIVAGAGVAGIGAGAVLGVMSQKKHADARDEPAQLTAEADQKDAKSLATGASIAFIAGGIVAGVGVVWGVIDLGASSTGGRAAIVPWPGGVALRITR